MEETPSGRHLSSPVGEMMRLDAADRTEDQRLQRQQRPSFTNLAARDLVLSGGSGQPNPCGAEH